MGVAPRLKKTCVLFVKAYIIWDFMPVTLYRLLV